MSDVINETNVNNEEVIESTVEAPENKPEVKSVTMTQDELNALISKEKGRVKSKYADYDEIKTKAAEYEKAVEEKRLAELSAQERAEEIAKQAQSEKEALEAELQKLIESNRQQAIKNEFFKVASALNVEYVDDAMKLADLSAVTVDEEGVKGVEDIVKALVEHKPFLVKKAKAEPKVIGDSTQSKSDNSDKTAEQLLKEAADRARKTGRTEDKIAYAQLKRDLQV
jgi:hypothetical protein